MIQNLRLWYKLNPFLRCSHHAFEIPIKASKMARIEGLQILKWDKIEFLISSITHLVCIINIRTSITLHEEDQTPTCGTLVVNLEFNKSVFSVHWENIRDVSMLCDTCYLNTGTGRTNTYLTRHTTSSRITWPLICRINLGEISTNYAMSAFCHSLTKHVGNCSLWVDDLLHFLYNIQSLIWASSFSKSPIFVTWKFWKVLKYKP